MHLASRVVKYLIKYVIYKMGAVAQPVGDGAEKQREKVFW